MTDHMARIQTILDRLRPDDRWTLWTEREMRQIGDDPAIQPAYVIYIEKKIDDFTYGQSGGVAEAAFESDVVTDLDAQIEKFVKIGIRAVRRGFVRQQRLN